MQDVGESPQVPIPRALLPTLMIRVKSILLSLQVMCNYCPELAGEPIQHSSPDVLNRLRFMVTSDMLAELHLDQVAVNSVRIFRLLQLWAAADDITTMCSPSHLFVLQLTLLWALQLIRACCETTPHIAEQLNAPILELQFTLAGPAARPKPSDLHHIQALLSLA